MMDQSVYQSAEKQASVTPEFNIEVRLIKRKYRPINVLNIFPKMFEKILLNQMMPFIDKRECHPYFMCGTQHVL